LWLGLLMGHRHRIWVIDLVHWRLHTTGMRLRVRLWLRKIPHERRLRRLISGCSGGYPWVSLHKWLSRVERHRHLGRHLTRHLGRLWLLLTHTNVHRLRRYSQVLMRHPLRTHPNPAHVLHVLLTRVHTRNMVDSGLIEAWLRNSSTTLRWDH
jgi:hypothetical protein